MIPQRRRKILALRVVGVEGQQFPLFFEQQGLQHDAVIVRGELFDRPVAVFIQPFVVAFSLFVGILNGVQQAIGIRRVPQDPHSQRRLQ